MVETYRELWGRMETTIIKDRNRYPDSFLTKFLGYESSRGYVKPSRRELVSELMPVLQRAYVGRLLREAEEMGLISFSGERTFWNI